MVRCPFVQDDPACKGTRYGILLIEELPCRRNEVLVFELTRRLTGVLVMVADKEVMVQEIVDDAALSTEQKVKKLREIESDARALQRAASESAMNADDGWDADLRLVRKALDKLGAVEPPKGAASL
jgi:hypothetical protein